ncbi:hypothetical protein MLD38_014786 [Melastoma candidum]|uniref:Uncharacterized protein n=1 Tax=Melastoma candidum TaxID=119954 RepID=A0ACB9RDS9_9MYRT|nr:hypothetical protein MLD38_014786 [Melastoma candidum]
MMNRGHVLEMSSSPVQQILTNPSWWNNISVMRPAPPLPCPSMSPLPPLPPPPPHPPLMMQQHTIRQPSHYYEPSLNSYPSLSLPSFALTSHGDINLEEGEEEEDEELPYDQSLSQLLLYGLAGDQDQKDNYINIGSIHHGKRGSFENWGSHQQYLQALSPNASSSITDAVKEEITINSPARSNYPNHFFRYHSNDDFVIENSTASLSTNRSCVTSIVNTNHPDPISSKKSTNNGKRLGRDPSSECEGSISGGYSQKRSKNQSSSASSSSSPQADHQGNFKVRKEKLGDRITTLHQLVSPFGKTDAASVLLEAIGYIRFLQGQIEALSLPYFGGRGPGSAMHEKSEFHGESEADLRSRGLCLVPISCTTRMGNDDVNGADFWAPALGSPTVLFR